MWINAQAVYKACYQLSFMKTQEKTELYIYWIDKLRDENTKFRWSRMKRTNLSHYEAHTLLHTTSYGDIWREREDTLRAEIYVLQKTIDHAFEAQEILEDGTCFVGQYVLNMIQPYLNGQERIEDDSRSD